jgi:hypothetical protein
MAVIFEAIFGEFGYFNQKLDFLLAERQVF